MCNVTKKILTGNVVLNENIADGVYRMRINVGETYGSCAPGQFINLYLDDPSKLLPRPISICDRQGDVITIVYGAVGAGTKLLSEYRSSMKIKLSSANGTGFNIDVAKDAEQVVLVGGGIGVPPMLSLAKAIKDSVSSVRVTAMLGFQREPFLADEFRMVCDDVKLASDAGLGGAFKGNVIACMEHEGIRANYYFSCGPRPMLEALCQWADAPVQVSMEERMGCGYGACVGCSIKIKQGSEIVQKKVCKDGPVFNGNEVVWRG